MHASMRSCFDFYSYVVPMMYDDGPGRKLWFVASFGMMAFRHYPPQKFAPCDFVVLTRDSDGRNKCDVMAM